MSATFATLADLLLKSAVVMFVLNELRGIVLAVPILWGMYEAGGTMMAIWLGISSLGGVLASVLIPLAAERKFGILRRLRAAAQAS